MELSGFARSLTAEAAFTVLAVAKRLQSEGKDVVELEIGDSPFATTSAAAEAGREAIAAGQTRYCASLGLPELRDAAARYMQREFGVPAGRDNVVIATGTKVFEQYFCEAFVDPGDGVLVFSPYFPTYVPNILRRGGRPVFTPLRQEDAFRPSLAAVERFIAEDPRPRAIFLNSPHNPTGGVATEEDFRGIAELVRGTRVAVFSDEPYCHMVWKGKHVSPLAQPGMMERSVAAYTFSKSYSMGGWRLGFAVSAPETVEAIGKMINTSVSCAPPFIQLAGVAALERDGAEREAAMRRFRRKVELLTEGLNGSTGSRRWIRTRPSTSSRRWRRCAIGSASPATAWRCTCSRGRTTTSGSPAWAASASATPGPGSCASAARLPTSACRRRWTSSPKR